MKTLFSKIIDGELPCHKIFEDEEFFAFLDINPVNPGHTLLVPKLPVDNVFDLEDDLFSRLFLTAKRLSAPLQKATGCKRVGIAVEGFCIPHVHVHLVPVNGGNELNPERAKAADPAELDRMRQMIAVSFEECLIGSEEEG